MNRFTNIFIYLIFFVMVLSINHSFAQDDPNIDNTIHLTPPQSIPSNSPLGREIITSVDGFDNFYLGVDFAEPHMSANPNNPTEYFVGHSEYPMLAIHALTDHLLLTLHTYEHHPKEADQQ